MQCCICSKTLPQSGRTLCCLHHTRVPVPTFSWVRWWGIGLSEVMCGVGQKIIGVSHVKSPGSGDCGSGLRPPWFDGTKGPGGDLLGVYVNVFAAKFFCKITVSIFRQECSGNTPKVDPPVTVWNSQRGLFYVIWFLHVCHLLVHYRGLDQNSLISLWGNWEKDWAGG